MSHSPLFADLSGNESSFDPVAYKNSGHVIIAFKASEGVGFVDPRYHQWADAAHHHGLAVIHYHFSRPDHHPGEQGGAQEAEAFLAATKNRLGQHDYVMYDGERRNNGTFGLQVDHSRGFDEHIQKHSRFHAILYASASQFAGAAGALVGEKKRDVDANYSSSPDSHAPGHELVARQFTDGLVGPGPHSLPGCGRCDVNVMHGSLLSEVFANAG